MRSIKLVAMALLAAVALAGGATESHAQTATVRMHIVKAGFIIGVGGGSGVLVYQGRDTD